VALADAIVWLSQVNAQFGQAPPKQVSPPKEVATADLTIPKQAIATPASA
jgi:hypothetical protein